MSVPFKLVIKLATPFVMGRTRTTLDGLLSAAVFKETGLMDKDTFAHIPLERGEGGIFKASCMFVFYSELAKTNSQICDTLA